MTARKPTSTPIKTVRVELAAFPGAWAVCRTSFKSRLLADMQTGEVDKLVAALEVVIVSHHLPDADDEALVAATLGDVALPVLSAVIEELGKRLGHVPNG